MGEYVSVTFHSGLKEILNKIANNHGLTLSQLMEEGIEDYFSLISINLTREQIQRFTPREQELILRARQTRLESPATVSWVEILKKKHDSLIKE